MYRILIVEDEPTMRDFCCNTVNWESVNIACDSACDGTEALEMILKQKYDVVVTDIKMPRKNGLELITAVKENGLNVSFIVLSSYDDFEYVSVAFKLGISEYLLKIDITPEILIQSVLSCIKRNDNITEYNNTPKYASDNQYIAKWYSEQLKFKNNILNNICDLWNCDSKLLLIKLYNANNVYLSMGESVKYAILNVINELSENDASCFMTDDSIAVIINRNTSHESIFKSIEDGMKKCFMIRIGGAVSKEGLSSYDAYCMAKDRLEYLFVNNCYSLIDTDVNNKMLSDNEANILFDMKSKQIGIILENIDVCDILSSAEKLIIDNNVRQKHAIEIFDMYCRTITHYALKNDLFDDIYEIFEEYEKIIKKECDRNDLNRWIKKILVVYSKLIKKNNIIIRKAIKYVDTNYNNEITLGDVSKHLNISENYFSTKFREVMGISFIKYLTSVRIEKAKELLSKSDYKVHEIAEMVGYLNVEHFSRVFKNIVGLSPKDYQRRKKK